MTWENASHNMYLPYTLPIQPVSTHPSGAVITSTGFDLDCTYSIAFDASSLTLEMEPQIHLAQGEPTRGKNRWLRHRLEYKVWRWMTHKTIHIFSTCNFATHTSPIYKQPKNLTSTCQQQKSIFLDFSHHLDILQERWCHCHGPPCRSQRWQFTSMASSPMPRWLERRWSVLKPPVDGHGLKDTVDCTNETTMSWCQDFFVTNFLLLVWHNKCELTEYSSFMSHFVQFVAT